MHSYILSLFENPIVNVFLSLNMMSCTVSFSSSKVCDVDKIIDSVK